MRRGDAPVQGTARKKPSASARLRGLRVQRHAAGRFCGFDETELLGQRSLNEIAFAALLGLPQMDGHAAQGCLSALQHPDVAQELSAQGG